MKRLTIARIVAALLLGAASVNAMAALVTFVASTGLDTNACTRASPCRTLQRAHSITNPGGTLIVLDSDSYGRLAVNRSISVIAPDGVQALIAVSTGTAVAVSAGAADIVVLKGLTLSNVGTANLGIQVNSGATVHVENCVVNGFTGAGIALSPTSAALTELFVKDSIVRNTRGTAGDGVVVNSETGRVKAVFDRVRVENSVRMGIFVRTGATTTVRDSVITGNGDAGLLVRSFRPSFPGYLVVENTVVAENLFGLAAGGAALPQPGPSTMDVSNSTITFNRTALTVGAGGAIKSRGNNTVRGNAAHGPAFGTFAAE